MIHLTVRKKKVQFLPRGTFAYDMAIGKKRKDEKLLCEGI